MKNEKKESPKTEEKKETKKLSKTDEIQELLQKQIEKNQKVMELIGVRKQFISTKDKLNTLLEDAKENPENFENDNVLLSLTTNSDYRPENFIKISNNLIIKEFIDFINIKIDNKLAELEKQIII